MKFISSLASIVAIGAFALSLFVSQYALGLYAVSFSASLVLILASDYTPRTARWEPRHLKAAAPAGRKAQRFQLAA